jgi:hypothetical protein
MAVHLYIVHMFVPTSCIGATRDAYASSGGRVVGCGQGGGRGIRSVRASSLIENCVHLLGCVVVGSCT